LLIANGADVNAKNDDGETPLYVATVYGKKEVADLLRKHGGQELRKPERRSACVPKAVRQQQTQPAREGDGRDGAE
jgi:ankyrin repeat protein